MEPEIDELDLIGKLPGEIQCMIMDTLTRAEKILCLMVSISWKQIIESFWSGIRADPNLLLFHAAKYDYKKLLEFAKLWGARRFDLGMKSAASAGNLELMVILKDWSLIKPQQLESPPHLVIAAALSFSARRGNIEGMKLAKSWGALKYSWAMKQAAGGSPKGMKLAKLWIETSSPTFRNRTLTENQKKRYVERTLRSAINISLKFSSLTGEIECMKLAKEWGADAYNDAMVSASLKCQFEAMKLLKEWGAYPFDKPIKTLAKCILDLKNMIERNVQKDPYGNHRAGSYIKIKIKGKVKPILVKVPTVSQKDHTLIYFQTELKKKIKCLELLKTWKKKETGVD